ncbi:hypothetical protein A0130_04650 [Leifsonia xyli]|uniref:DUF4190 domain-containing protein n=1 Tax=Leifsonia xyli TaxID=1575 RepID=UPI0007CDD8BB|nr:hypothetical protein A0130_04650 [Leifsonia xyli]
MSATTQTTSRWNTMAVVGFVFLFVFSPLALVLGAAGLSQIARTGERGRALALIAVILGGLKLIGSLFKLVMLIFFGYHYGTFYDYVIW